MSTRHPMGLLIGHPGRSSRGRDRRRTPRSRTLGAVERLEGRTLLSGAGEWAFRFGGPSNELANHATVDPAGDLYVTGSFTGTVDFDPADAPGTDDAAILTSGGGGADQDIFVAKYAPTGAFLWARHMGGSAGDNSGRGIAFAQDPATGAQSVVVAGYFYGSADFSGAGAGGAAVRTSSGGADAFVEKIDAGGNMLWVTTLGGSSDDMGRKVAVDGQGNAYVTGSFTGTARLGPSLTLTSASSGSTNPTSDAFVARLDGSGNVVWAKGGGGSANDYGYGVAVGRSATGATAVIVTGNIGGATSGRATFGSVGLPNNPGGLVWELDAGSGSTDWAQEVVPSAGRSATGSGIATDSAGDIYVTGSVAGAATFDGTTLTSLTEGYNDVFVAKLAPSGALTWVKVLGNVQGLSDPGKLWVDDQGNVYATGSFFGVTDFNTASPGTARFASAPHSDDGYVWEMDSNGGFLSAWNTGPNVFPYAAVPFRDPATGAPALDVVGSFSGTATLPTGDTLSSAGGNDNFALELNRQLGTLAGTVYDDLNANGINDDASPLGGWTVSLSQSQNGVLVPTGLSATTDAQGRYTFSNLAAGTYSVSATPPSGASGYTQTAPAAGQARVATLGAGQFAGGLDFGESTPDRVKTYGNTTAVRLAGGTTSTSSITISDSYPIYDLNVTVNITQANDSNIAHLTLTAPDGTAVELVWYVTSTGANFTSTTFDDAAATPIAAGAAPFTGSFRPLNLLNAFDGKNINGTWKLSVTESGSGRNSLGSWSLAVTGPQSGAAGATSMPAATSPSTAIAPASVATPPDTAGMTLGSPGGAALASPPAPAGSPSSTRASLGRVPDRPAASVKVGAAVPVPSRVRPGAARPEASRRPLVSVA